VKESLDIPDIRNKLSPITNLIQLIEKGEFGWAMKQLKQCKKSVNYLADRKVFDDENKS
jgi:hypothetical protein